MSTIEEIRSKVNKTFFMPDDNVKPEVVETGVSSPEVQDAENLEEKIEETVEEEEITEESETVENDDEVKVEKKALLPTNNYEIKNAISLQLSDVINQTRARLNEIVPDDTFSEIQNKVNKELTKSNYVEKRKAQLSKVADQDVLAEIDRKKNEVRAKKARNIADRQAIKNALYNLKQEKKRAVEFQKALNEEQKRNIKDTEINQLWAMHGETLKKYGFTQIHSTFGAKIILAMDSIKGFFIAADKVSNKLLRAFKWLFIAGALVGLYFLLKHFNILN